MNILNLLAGDNYFIYNKDIAKNMGTDVAIILGLLCNKYNYYQKENKLTMLDGKEYFYCTREHIYNETGLKESCQRKAMKILEDNNILEHKKVGIPSKNYYYINQEKLLETIEKLSSVKNKGLEIQNENDLSLKNYTQIIYNNTKKENTNNKDIMLSENIKCIIDYLNESINSKYKYTTKGTISCIKSRFKEGYVLDDFYDVIDKKVKEWINTDMEKYLRPETLFGNKFENYLNQKTYLSGKPKSSYSSKPTFDNTATHKTGNDKISDAELDKLSFEEKRNYIMEMDFADMTEKQKEFHNKYCLARDENGNLISF